MWMCGVSTRERQTSTEEAIGDVTRRYRLRRHGHVERKDAADWVKTYTRFVMEGTALVCKPKNTWQNTVSDMRLLGVEHRDHVKRRAIGSPRTTQKFMEHRLNQLVLSFSEPKRA